MLRRFRARSELTDRQSGEVPLTTEVGRLIADVERVRAVLLESVADLSESEAAFKPSATEWSILEILEHLYLAELSGVSKIWAALHAVRAGQRWTGQRPHRGKRIEEIISATWKPKEAAPPIATPHIGGPLGFWIAATQTLTPVLAHLGEALGDVNLEDVVFPHFLSGPLDGRQRLEFLRFHIERHMAQIAKVRAGVGFPHDAP